MRSLEDVSLKNKTVLLRLDLNVPIDRDKVTDNYRLKAVVPTLNYLIERDAKIVVISHLGRPKGRVESELSLRPIYQELSELIGTDISFIDRPFSPEAKEAIAKLSSGEIVGLENIRFESGEEENSRTLAKKLSSYGEIFVNDAFAVSHRSAASIVAITEFLPSYPGLLLEKETQILKHLLAKPERPYLTIVGGSKIADKLELVNNLILAADKILIGGGIANTFLMAGGVDVKSSLVELDKIEIAKSILARSRGKIILPEDYVWSDDRILDIGRLTVSRFVQHLAKAKTVFWNGCLGYTEDERFSRGSNEIANFLANLAATTVVGGGNTVEVLTKLNLTRKFSFVSSGGGATLEYLSGRQLPGLIALDQNRDS